MIVYALTETTLLQRRLFILNFPLGHTFSIDNHIILASHIPWGVFLASDIYLGVPIAVFIPTWDALKHLHHVLIVLADWKRFPINSRPHLPICPFMPRIVSQFN